MSLFGKKLKNDEIDRSFMEEMTKAGLEKHARFLYSYAKKAIYFDVLKIDENIIPIGKTKIGGHPDLYEGFKWPLNEGHYLAFLAQVNLADVSHFDHDHILPSRGMLYFFYDSNDMPWGYDIQDRDAFRVFYYDIPLDKLKRLDYPTALSHQLDSIFPAVAVRLSNKWSLPNLEKKVFKNDKYLDYISLEDGKETYMLGYCKNIQEDVSLSCAMTKHDCLVDHFHKLTKQEKQKLKLEKDEWILLFQLDSINECHMMWGDMGILYFMIRKDDLSNRRFENVWMILQCY